MNKYEITTSYIKKGDRVLVQGAEMMFSERNWGTVLSTYPTGIDEYEFYVEMDDPNIPYAKFSYEPTTSEECYRADDSQIVNFQNPLHPHIQSQFDVLRKKVSDLIEAVDGLRNEVRGWS